MKRKIQYTAHYLVAMLLSMVMFFSGVPMSALAVPDAPFSPQEKSASENTIEVQALTTGSEAEKSAISSTDETVEGSTENDSGESRSEEALSIESDANVSFATIPETPEEELLAPNQLMGATRALTTAPSLSSPLRSDWEPVTVDGITVQHLTMKWLSKSTGASEPAGYNDLVLIPSEQKVPNQQWQMDLDLDGKGKIDIGDVEIVIPAYIWVTRDGKEPGRLTLAAPEEPEVSGDFSWKRVGDTIVITNTKKLAAGSKYMIQGTFRMTYPDVNSDKPFTTAYAYQFVDIDVDDSVTYPNGVTRGRSNDFFAKVNITTPSNKELLSATSNSINATIDTSVQLKSFTKRAETTGCFEWQSSANNKHFYRYDSPYVTQDLKNKLTELIPGANPNDYIYLRWYVQGTVSGNQPFTLTIQDSIPDEYDGILLGANSYAYSDLLKSSTTDGHTATVTWSGSRADVNNNYWAYIWSAYPREHEAFMTEEGQTSVFNNSATATVRGADDLVPSTKSATATNTVWLRAPKTWKANKEWEDDNNSRGRRPSSATARFWGDGSVLYSAGMTEANNWHVEWTDYGTFKKGDVDETNVNVGRSYLWSDVLYDENGMPYFKRYWYSYRQIGKEVNEANREWTFTNEYFEYFTTYFPSSSFQKSDVGYSNSARRVSSDRALNLLRDGTDVIIPWTVSENLYLHRYLRDADNGVTISIEDTLAKFQGQNLGSDDYEIAYVDLSQPTLSLYEANSEHTAIVTTPLAEKTPVYLFGRQSNTDEWVRYAVLDVSGAVTAENGATVNGRRVSLPANVAFIKAETSTDKNLINFGYSFGMKLKASSEKVAGIVASLFAANEYALGVVENYAKCSVIKDGVVQGALSDSEPAYLHGRDYHLAVDLDKNMVYVKNDKLNYNLRFKASMTLRQQSNIAYKSEFIESLENNMLPDSESGTFYDLLPPGMRVDEETITVSGGSVITKIDIVDNFRDTGRQLLKVSVRLGDTNTVISRNRSTRYANDVYSNTEANQSIKLRDATYPNPDSSESWWGKQHTISFEMVYPYQEALQRGWQNSEALRNYSAYEADEELFGDINNWKGEPDNPTAGYNKESQLQIRDTAIQQLFTNLDATRDDPSFVYASWAPSVSEIDFAALTSIQKYVALTGSDEWVNGHDGNVNVQAGGKYSYMIRLISGASNTTSDIIIVDKLDSYVAIKITNSGSSDFESGDYVSREEYLEAVNYAISNGEEPPTGEDAQTWQGKLLDVDVSGIRDKGVNPVVYYCTAPEPDVSNLNPGGDLDVVPNYLADPANGWQTSKPSDLSSVTAIAIDCRYTIDGEPFELDRNEDLIAYVHMQAPTYKECPEAFAEEGYTDPVNNRHAFNDTYMDVTQTGVYGGGHAYRQFGFTELGIAAREVVATKIWDDADDNDGYRPDSITVRLYADGELYSDPDNNERTLTAESDWESVVFKHLPVYNDDLEKITYTVEELGTEHYTSDTVALGDSITITNTHELDKTELHVTKKWETEGDEENWELKIPRTVRFHLWADYKDGKGKVDTLKTLLLTTDGKNDISGVFSNLQKYKNGELIEYSVTEEPVSDFKQTIIHTDNNETAGVEEVTNTYYPYGDLVIKKEITNPTTYADEHEFPFTFVLTDKDGNTITDSYDYEIYDAEGVVQRSGSITSESVFVLKHGQYVRIKDIPSTYKYSVSEDPLPGYTVTSANPVEGSITTSPTASHIFENEYYANINVNIPFTKTLTGTDLRERFFSFELRDAEGNVIKTSRNNADGSALFTLSFNNTDAGKTHTYTINEFDTARSGYVYDHDIYQAEITLADNGDGTMSSSVVYKKVKDSSYIEDTDPASPTFGELIEHIEDVDISVDAISFANEYRAKGQTVLRLWKDMKVWELAGNDFTFELLDENENVLQTKTNAADGSIVFDPLEFNETNIGETYHYKVREVVPEQGTSTYDERIIYDETEHNYDVTVYDNGDGTLSFAQSKDQAVPVFTNDLQPGKLSVSKYAENDENADPNQEFKFRVKFTGEGIADKDFSVDIGLAPESERPLATSGTESHMAAPPANSASVSEGEALQANDAASGGNNATASTSLMQPSIWERLGFIATAYAAEGDATASGQYDGVTWKIVELADGTKQLQIGQEGATQTFTTATSRSASSYPWYNYRSEINSVVFLGTVKGAGSMSGMFHSCAATSLDLTNFDTSAVTNMSSMFHSCAATSLDLTNFDTSAVTNMSAMFNSAKATSIIFGSAFSTSNVTNMSNLFQNTQDMDLDLSGWDTSNVTTMEAMFHSSRIKNIDLRSFETPNLINMYGMFAYAQCETLDLSNFDIFDKNPDKASIFYSANKLKKIVLGPRWHFGAGKPASQYTGLSPSLPTPSGAGYTGMWINVDKGITRTAYQLVNQYGANASEWAGTWEWQVKGPYNIEFVAPGAAGSMPTVTDINAAEPYTLPLNTFMKPGYDFDYWVDQNNSAYTYADGEVVPAWRYIETTVTLEAVFKKRDSISNLGDGVYELTLRKNEMATFNDIPAGTAYQVWEETPDGWKLVREVDSSGTINSLETAKAKFTNRYTPGETSAQFHATKLLDNTVAAEGAFTFALYELANDGTESLLQTVTNTTAGAINFTAIDYSAAGTYKYVIRELKPSEQSPAGTDDPTINYDTHEELVTVSVTDDGQGQLHAAVAYENEDLVFSNSTKPGVLEVKKVINENSYNEYPQNDTFTFRVFFTNSSELPLAGTYSYKVLDSEGSEIDSSAATTDENNALSLSCQAGQTIQINGLPAGIRYVVEEINLPQGWQQTDSGTTGLAGTITAGSTSAAQISNEYHLDARGAVTGVELVAHKRLVGADLTPGAFTFVLYDEDHNVIDTKANLSVDTREEVLDENGSIVPNPWRGTALVQFDGIGGFTEDDIGKSYTYFIRELKPSEQDSATADDPLISYDSHEEEVTVAFSVEDGVITSHISYDNDGPLFENTLLPGSIDITKTTINDPGGETEFSFQISFDADVSPVVNPASAEFTKNENAENTWDFKLKAGEKLIIDNLPNGVSYEVVELDKTAWVQTGSSGEKGVVVSGETQHVAFENTYQLEGVVPITAKKILNGATLKAGQFSFELVDEYGEVIATTTNQADGSIEFNVQYTQANIDRRYFYSIREKLPDEDNRDQAMVYDSTSLYELSVFVESNGAGGLSTSVTYEDEERVFTNTDLNFTIRKTNNDANSPMHLAGAIFTLHRTDTSSEPWTVDDSSYRELTTGDGQNGTVLGEVSAHGLEPGTYILREMWAPEGYKESDLEWVLVVSYNASGVPDIQVSQYGLEAGTKPDPSWTYDDSSHTFVLSNELETYRIRKVGSETGNPTITDPATFKLQNVNTSDSAHYGKWLFVSENGYSWVPDEGNATGLKTDSAGELALPVLSVGNYILKETEAPRNYQIIGDGIYYLSVGDTASDTTMVHSGSQPGSEVPKVYENNGFATFRIENALLPEEDRLYKFTVSKELEGNLVDNNQSFVFAVDIPDAANVQLNDGLKLDSNGHGTFFLRGGSSITLNNIPHGASVMISENDYSSSGYGTKYSVNGSSSVLGRQYTENSMNADTKIVFTNSRYGSVPTGVNDAAQPWVLCILAAVLLGGVAIYTMRRNKKHGKHERLL